MDAQYSIGAKPSWEDLQEEMKDRYLPADHELQLESRFERTWQKGTLVEYVEKFQILVSAMKFAGVVKTEQRMILQFVKGMTEKDERRFMVAREPQTLKAMYKSVTMLRQVKAVDGPSGRTGPPKKKFSLLEAVEEDTNLSQLLKLSAAEKQKAFETGKCVGCGKSGHFINNCPEVKKTIKMLQGLQAGSPGLKVTQTKRKPKKKFRKAETVEEESEASISEESGNEGDQSPRED